MNALSIRNINLPLSEISLGKNGIFLLCTIILFSLYANKKIDQFNDSSIRFEFELKKLNPSQSQLFNVPAGQ